MNKLLDRLKQVDPTTYKRYNTDKIICDMELVIAVKNAWLQACLQTAIRSRGGWYWKISSRQLDSTGKYVCEIVKESGWKTVWVREEGNSPAEAMLAAYIEAMS